MGEYKLLPPKIRSSDEGNTRCIHTVVVAEPVAPPLLPLVVPNTKISKGNGDMLKKKKPINRYYPIGELKETIKSFK